MSAGPSEALIDTQSPFWTFASDFTLAAAFFAPALSLLIFLLRRQFGCDDAQAKNSSPSTPVRPEDIEGRAGAYSEQMRAADAAENERLHADIQAKVQGQ